MARAPTEPVIPNLFCDDAPSLLCDWLFRGDVHSRRARPHGARGGLHAEAAHDLPQARRVLCVGREAGDPKEQGAQGDPGIR